ncbi:hypothetical protein [Glutamicibacter sp. NPDC087344]|uniref:hypothetical protein n=1 Tax=Glutamicibacter sp. NPDC087344 TaxID=3363994 RepID=UPI0038239817
MKALKMLAVAALVLAPITAVAAPASADSGSTVIGGGAVATPAGWGTDLSNWFCKHYGISC